VRACSGGTGAQPPLVPLEGGEGHRSYISLHSAADCNGVAPPRVILTLGLWHLLLRYDASGMPSGCLAVATKNINKFMFEHRRGETVALRILLF